tara:strand:+ start:288 stop:1088 length:801 start_codon:yes stop_codon:yes gene_type:complete
MATPTSKAELKAYAKRRLGDPVIEINISDDQADDAIDYTIEKFQHFHYEGAERVYLKHQFTEAEITNAKTDTSENAADGSTTWLTQNNYISVPDHIMSIEGIFGFTDKGTRNMFDIRYQMRLNDLYDFTSTQFYHYYMIQQHLETIDFLLEGMKPIRYQNVQDKLYIDFDWVQDALEDQYVVIKAWRALNPTTWTEIYNQLWVKDYVTAKFKKQWGQNMTKFQNVQMPGGVTLNGEMIYNDAVKEIQELDDQLRSTWETPPLDMIG